MNKPLIAIAAARPKKVIKYQLSVEQVGAEVEALFPESFDGTVLDRADGLLLTGGGDIDASEFDEVNHAAVCGVDKKRDEMELSLTRQALERGIPVFGICRGIQVMNVALGGSLIQHIPDEVRTTVVHDDSKNSRQNLVHEVRILEETLLHRVLQKDRLAVNSFHHQSVKQLGRGLIANAWSDDGVVEGIELPGENYFLGVQWHPEEFVEHGALFARLFESFVEATRFRKLIT
jgi:putative glutamine amidotransferase